MYALVQLMFFSLSWRSHLFSDCSPQLIHSGSDKSRWVISRQGLSEILSENSLATFLSSLFPQQNVSMRWASSTSCLVDDKYTTVDHFIASETPRDRSRLSVIEDGTMGSFPSNRNLAAAMRDKNGRTDNTYVGVSEMMARIVRIRVE